MSITAGRCPASWDGDRISAWTISMCRNAVLLNQAACRSSVPGRGTCPCPTPMIFAVGEERTSVSLVKCRSVLRASGVADAAQKAIA